MSRDYVAAVVDAIGEQPYVELVGVVSCLAAVDAFTQLVGAGIAPLPDPHPGDPTPDDAIPGLKLRRAWVSTAGPRGPHHALSAAPAIQGTFNRLLDLLYIDRDDLGDLGPIRALSRTQAELVILAVSHRNECFY
ncbi:MAG TPA: hypothetical protein VLG28_01520 [Acidimicrobiia bacterium]|nr:hypothetical protein [Acidimicrobiia bacterium]